MLRHGWKPIALLAAGVLLALGAGSLQRGTPATAQDLQAELAELLASEDATSAELAVGLLRALEGESFAPPACVAGQERFDDVPATNPFCAWIEELARRGITGGCTATNYCPGSPVTRAQMAVFIVKSMEACPTLDPTDEMIRVGGVCIDKYEASLWDAPVGGNQITGTIPCNENGQDCDTIYARSVAGVQPRASITWFQAQAALSNSGKRLPTNAEWQMAVRGTPDGSLCNVGSGGPALTGSFPNCVSAIGALDMVGNVWEWVGDWVPFSTDCPGWGDFSDDAMCLSGAATTTESPAALLRGGDWGKVNAGPFAVSGIAQPTSALVFFGFRGAR